MAKMTARQAATAALMKVNNEGGYSNLVLNEMLKKAQLSLEDNAFAGRLFYGTLERKLTLDHIIGAYSKKPVKNMTPAVAEILRTALYQLLYLDSVPDSAAVNEAVKLTRVMKVSSASGFVNAVLRGFLRDEKRIPAVRGNRIRRMEVQYSCPQWLIRHLIEAYGEQSALSVLEHSLGRPPLYARVNTQKGTAEQCIEQLSKEGVRAEPDRDLKNCILLSATASIERLDAFQQGLFHVQDKSSQLCAEALGAREGERILDCCSAPGSKSFTTAQKMKDRGEIVSCDIFDEKVKKIAEGAQRLGLRCISPQKRDATVFDGQLGQFDRVLCDVPCSGIGIISRKPEIKYKKEQELKELPNIQAKILEQAARYVKVGGRLVYSTCTLLKQENTEVVEEFLSRHREFEPCPLEETVRTAAEVADNTQWQLTLLPEMADTDGFFIACMKKVR